MTNDPKEQTIDCSKLLAQKDNGCAVIPKTEIKDKKYPEISIGFSFTDV